MGLLSLAGAVSGMGQGLERGLSQLQAQVGAAGIAEEADKRVVARENTAYQRRRFDIEDERKYSDQLRAKLFAEQEQQKDIVADHDLTRKEKNLGREAEIEEKQFDTRSGLRKKTRDEGTTAEIEKDEKKYQAGLTRREDNVDREGRIATKEFESGKPKRTAERKEKIEGAIEETTALAGNKDYLTGKQAIADAGESRSHRVQADVQAHALERVKHLEGLQDKVVEAAESGDHEALVKANRAYLAASGKLMESEKLDQAAASALMRDTREQIRYLQVAMRDMVPASPEYKAAEMTLKDLQQMNQAAQTRLASTSGVTLPQTPKPGTMQIKDRFAPQEKPGGMIAEAKKGTRTVPPPSASEQQDMAAATGAPAQTGPAVTNPGPWEAFKGGVASATEGIKEIPGKIGNAVASAVTPYSPENKVKTPDANEQAQMRAALENKPQGTGMIAQAGPPPEAEAIQGEDARDAQVMQLLQGHEGFKGTPYKDSGGKTTIGYGHNLDAKPLKPEQAKRIMQDDIDDARQDATKLPYYEKLDPVRQDAVTALVYNMGLGSMKGFKRFNAAMEQGNWELAKQELLKSDWAKQVQPDRVATMTQMILTGRYTQ